MGGARVIVLDTHVLLWADSADRKLGRKTKALVDRQWSDGQVAICSISFWEAGMLAERGRIRLGKPVVEWRADLLAAGLTEVPLDGSTALRSLELAGLPGDPADRFIAACALVSGATLVTADERILAWPHALPRHDATT
jgi:PIN domain nuclease of toxin-antitoxin system